MMYITFARFVSKLDHFIYRMQLHITAPSLDSQRQKLLKLCQVCNWKQQMGYEK